MAYITGSVFDSLGILPFSLAAGTQLTMSIQNNSNAPSYYGLETIPNNNGFYTAATPKNTSGSYVSGSGISYITYDDYKMVAVVNPGGGTLVYTPSVAVSASTVWTKGTGASLLPADFGTLLPGSYNQRVVNSGGYVESPDSITAAIAATPILKDASFLYIPSGYSSGTAFSELSTNDYGDLTWTRASDGTRTNSEGLVQRVPWNLVQYSETFNNAYWTKSNTTISADTTTAPNGTLTADTLIEDTSNSTHRIFNNTAVTVSTSIASTYSVYLKSAGRTRAWVRDNDIVGALFNLSNGTVVSTEGTATATITNVGDGWYRCTITKINTTVSGRIVIYLDNGTSETYTGNGTSGIYIWGAQVVEGTSAQSYLTTTTRLNVPRLDYTYGTSPASLMEPQRTNLQINSEDFTQWVATNATVTANNTTSPDGTQNADRVQFTGAGFLQGVIQVSGTTYTISCWAKRNGSGTQSVGFFKDGSGVVDSAWALTSNWQRFTYTYTASNNSRSGIAGVNGGDVFVYGAQLEVGAYPTTYIPTTSTTVTRLVDTFSRNNVYTNGMITSTGGTWYTELRNNIAYIRDSGTFPLFLSTTSGSGGSSNSLEFRNATAGSPVRLSILKRVAGTGTLLFNTTTDIVKVAINWNGSTADVFVNGIKQVSATAFTTTNMEFLNGFGTDVPLFIQAMALYSQPIAGVDMGVLTGASYYPSFLNMAQANNYTIA
jgi:hypothetical protein